MREQIIEALKKHAEGHIEKHKTNVEVLLQKTAGIAEHPDTLETIEKMKKPKTIEHKKKISYGVQKWWDTKRDKWQELSQNR